MKQQLRWEAWKKGLKVYFRITISNIQLLFTAKVNLEKLIPRPMSLDCSAIQTQQEHAHSTQKSPWPSEAFIQWGDSAKCCSSDICKILTSLQYQQLTFQDAEAWNFLSWQKNAVRLWLFNTFTLIQIQKHFEFLELVTDNSGNFFCSSRKINKNQKAKMWLRSNLGCWQERWATGSLGALGYWGGAGDSWQS